MSLAFRLGTVTFTYVYGAYNLGLGQEDIPSAVKDLALEIPYHTIRKVEAKEDMLNWRIELDTDEGMIALSAQQKELSEWRNSGTLSVGMSGLGSGITDSGALKVANWHRSNLDATLEALKALPVRREEIA